MKDNTMQNTQTQDTHQGIAGRTIRITRIFLAVFGLGWGFIVLFQTYQSGLSILLAPSFDILDSGDVRVSNQDYMWSKQPTKTPENIC